MASVRSLSNETKFRKNRFNMRTVFMNGSLSYRNQCIDLLCKSMEKFLYDRDLVMKELKKNFIFDNCNHLMVFINGIHAGCDKFCEKDNSRKDAYINSLSSTYLILPSAMFIK